MMKSIYYMNYLYPIILNLTILILISTPSNNFKMHPMMLMITLILLTLMICLTMNSLMSSWIPFMLFLSIIGGLMIIFMYVTSVANNELFKFDMKNYIMYLYKMICSMMLLMMTHFKMFQSNLNDLMNMDMKFMNFNESMMSFFLKSNIYLIPTVFMMLYLLYSMVCVMNICYINKKPLRQIKK